MVPSLEALTSGTLPPGLAFFRTRVRTMLVDEKDRPIVRWAIEKAFPFEYRREACLPDPCLRVRLGLSMAYFHKGKLVHWCADCDGDYLDQLMYEMTSLFSLCAKERAYVHPSVYLSPPEMVSLKVI